MNIDMTLHDTRWRAGIPDVKNLASRTLEQARNHPQVLLRLCLEQDTEVSLTLSNDEFVQRLNSEYRGKDKPTNVLSFPMLDDNEEEKTEVGNQGDEDAPSEDDEIFAETLVTYGDIVMAYETVAKEAQDQKKSMRDHFTHLLLHGFLHLLGFDHENDEDAEEMEEIEAEILAAMNIENPYERI